MEQQRAEHLQLLGAALAAGKTDEIGTWADAQRTFDEALAAPDDPNAALLRELGVA